LKKETYTSNIIAQHEKLVQSGNDFQRLYPRIKERRAPLSTLGISPRTFIHWKEQGLVWHVETDEEKRTWVRLNVYEYVWLRCVIAMREFGVPLENISAFKAEVEKSMARIAKDDWPALIDRLKKETTCNQEQIENFERSIDRALEQEENFSLEDKQAVSCFGTMINLILLIHDRINMIIVKNDGGFTISFNNKLNPPKDNNDGFSPWTSSPHLTIPLYPFVVEMINEPKNDTHIQEWGLINANERKVLDAMRRKDFREIVVKPLHDAEDFIIELTTDENVMGEKAKRLKTILGLDEYSAVTIKYRNDKNLFFRNTRKL
jgi:DNA-binding transcriptional MerR regulator